MPRIMFTLQGLAVLISPANNDVRMIAREIICFRRSQRDSER